MSIFDALIDKLAARVVAESAAGDPGGERPETPPLQPLESPYACRPTRWGEGEEPPRAPRPHRVEPAADGPRKPRRMTLAVRREPAPRGLLSI